ncbi:2-amino-4-hydroxy-6-hydroxymethyldihydropteridine diphosphokinase [Catenovulum maritimum]|uniref:2-amino-4-hydroxy-6-hydroxymethyldihydropteridine diphosphokinase n=1 Tax=Catenovulum maritimum TaxID=1513271 RepID=A0A0J8H0L9_9ALTE|nr:2-amino-4-hydroxy-6-hydroxymethyldihydropteridine diphosphokinase [Catenovulum maritimum]KMT66558.1 phosphokinase [Catenovulum maritimum]
MALIAVSLGTNVAAEYHLTTAIHLLRPYFKHLLISPVYQSEPVKFSGENFLNICFGGELDLTLEQTLKLLKSIESQYQRDRTSTNKSEITLDLDLLFYDDLITEIPVKLPRAEILKNAFVLQPLNDIFADKIHPETKTSYQNLWQAYDQSSQKLWPINFDWKNKRMEKL